MMCSRVISLSFTLPMLLLYRFPSCFRSRSPLEPMYAVLGAADSYPHIPQRPTITT